MLLLLRQSVAPTENKKCEMGFGVCGKSFFTRALLNSHWGNKYRKLAWNLSLPATAQLNQLILITFWPSETLCRFIFSSKWRDFKNSFGKFNFLLRVSAQVLRKLSGIRRGMSSTLSKGSPEVGNKYSRGILSYHLKATFTKDKMRDTASSLHATRDITKASADK
jgi:hypothetical protein